MISRIPACRVAWLALAVSLLPAAARAQYPAQQSAQPIVQPLPQANDPASRLAANLQILAQNPRDVIALTEAGRSAIAVGDGNAAIGFLTRAEELSPGDSRIKADIGSALLLLEEPGEALKLFAEASALGLPDRVFAKDRGLAYDLTGDPRRAQRDYQTALRQSDDDEVTRRLALSFGISGDRDSGLKLLDPLLRKQDQAAWRDRAFILAMNGDIKDAERIAEKVMPYGMANSMTPFLRRLVSLTPAQRARAVNFGTMPDDGLRTAMADTVTPFRSVDADSARQLMPVEPQPVAKAADASPTQSRRSSKEPRRRPGRERQTFAVRQPRGRSSTAARVGIDRYKDRQPHRHAHSGSRSCAAAARSGWAGRAAGRSLAQDRCRPLTAASASSANRFVPARTRPGTGLRGARRRYPFARTRNNPPCRAAPV